MGAVLAFAAQVLLARFLGATFFGEVGVVVSLTTIVGLCGTLGLGVLGLRLLARWHADRDQAERAGYAAFSYALATGIAVVIGTAIGTLGAFILGYPPEFAILVAALCVATTLWGLGSDLGRGLERFASTYGASVVVRPLVTVVLVGCLIGLGTPGSPVVGLGVLTAGGLVAVTIQVAVIFRAVRPVRWPTWSRGRGWLKAAPPFLMANAVVLVLLQADTLVAGAILEGADLGHYVAAIRTVGVLSIISGGITTVAAPRFARSGDRKDTLAEEVRVATRWSSVLTTIGACAVLACSPWILGAFGAGFVDATGALAILAAGQVINCLFGPSGTVLVYAGYPRDATLGFALCIPLNVVFTAFGALLWGLSGAATGSAVGQIAAGVVMWRLAARRTGVNTAVAGPRVFTRGHPLGLLKDRGQ